MGFNGKTNYPRLSSISNEIIQTASVIHGKPKYLKHGRLRLSENPLPQKTPSVSQCSQGWRNSSAACQGWQASVPEGEGFERTKPAMLTVFRNP